LGRKPIKKKVLRKRKKNTPEASRIKKYDRQTGTTLKLLERKSLKKQRGDEAGGGSRTGKGERIGQTRRHSKRQNSPTAEKK